MNLEDLGKMAELQDEITPIQLGTSGFFQDKSFDVIGRLKVSYEDGSWNEWYTISNRGEEGWLAEAQGFYAMCFPVNLGTESHPGKYKVPELTKVHVGLNIDLSDHGTFKVDDIHEVVCKYAEGELPMQAAKGRESVSVDLRGDKGSMATIEYAKDAVRLYIGKYQDFDLFKFKNLRKLDGW
jgi:hypothetical protein